MDKSALAAPLPLKFGELLLFEPRAALRAISQPSVVAGQWTGMTEHLKERHPLPPTPLFCLNTAETNFTFVRCVQFCNQKLRLVSLHC
jgi:hypothetical protein